VLSLRRDDPARDRRRAKLAFLSQVPACPTHA
jgi:hypothetical protein